MRISAILLATLMLIGSTIMATTCTEEPSIVQVKPISVRVRSVPPKAIPRPSSSGGGRGGRYSSSGGK